MFNNFQIQIVLSEDVLFTSLVEAEDTGMIGTGGSTTGGNEENVQLAYRQLPEIEKVIYVVTLTIEDLATFLDKLYFNLIFKILFCVNLFYMHHLIIFCTIPYLEDLL